jgi:ABC-type branched-subunit amino acid transport system substrate-binding protein
LISLYFFLCVIFTITVGNLVIIFAEPDSKLIYSNWILIINSLVAAGLASYVFLKSRESINENKENMLLTIGLVFWCIANIIWAYYEVVLDIVSPVPSLADFFLLSAYVFLIYRLMIIIKKLNRVINKKIMYLMIGLAGLFLAYILNLTLDMALTSNFRGTMLFIVTIAYPTLNSILTVLAITILLGIKSEKQHRHLVPWVSESAGFLAIVVGDSWFAIIVLTTSIEQLWISTLLLSAHYLLIAGGLIWYLRYSIKWKSNDLAFKIVAGIRKRRLSNKIIVTSITIIGLVLFSSVYLGTGFGGDGGKNSLLIKKDHITEKSSLTSTDSASNGQDNLDKEFVVGAIIPITGSYSSIGKPVKVALEKAEHDVNKYFEKMNSSSRFNLAIANSKSSPKESLEAVKQLHSLGAKFIVGPATSTAVLAAKEYADTNDIILISYSSTSPLLAIAGDNLLRLVPDDINQGKAIAERMIDDGIKVVVPMWRGDIYGNELYKSTKYHYEKLGGKMEEGINYKPHTGKFATSLHRINFIMWDEDLNRLNAIVSDAIKKYDSKSVGVFIISYDEITPILIQSPMYRLLDDIRWYGSDSIAQNHHITKNIDSALFAIKTNFSNPLYSIDTESPKIHELIEMLEKELHNAESITYPAIAYDAFWISSLSLDTNSTNNSYSVDHNNINKKSFQDIVFETVESFDDGISGKIQLNDAGDRIGENYDFWSISKDVKKSHYVWKSKNNILELHQDLHH